ncbi:hypothetical protein D3C75_281930 [compost metagenome]
MIVMKGAFQTSREIFENPIWQDVVKFRIFFFIVGNAVFAEEGVTVSGIQVGRGQFLRSYRNLIKDLEYIENRSIKKYSLSVISKKIEQLVKEERLKIEDTELGTLFTVVNYAEYQGFDRYKKESENGERTEKEQRENGVRTEKERSENNNNNVNKDKNDKNVKKKDNTAFEEYTSNPTLIESLESFVEYRKKIKKPMTDTAIKLLLGNLDKLADDDSNKIAILNQSILNGWQGIFALKENSKARQGANKPYKPDIPIVESTADAQPVSDEEMAELMKLAEEMKRSKQNV